MDTIQDRRLREAYGKVRRALERREECLKALVRIELAIKQARKEVRRKELRVAGIRPVEKYDPQNPMTFYGEDYPFRHEKIDIDSVELDDNLDDLINKPAAIP